MFCFERRQLFPFSRASLVLGVVSALLGAECPGARWAPGMPPSGCSDVPCFLVPKVSPASRTISPFVSSGLRSEAGRPWEAMWPPSPLPHPEVVSVLASAVVPVGAANECPLRPPSSGSFPFPDVVGQEVLVCRGPPQQGHGGASGALGRPGCCTEVSIRWDF